MFGNKLLSKATIKVTEEGFKQHTLVRQEIGKLSELTSRGWDLVTSEMFDKVRKISFGEGFVCGTALTGLTVIARKLVKKCKDETDGEE